MATRGGISDRRQRCACAPKHSTFAGHCFFSHVLPPVYDVRSRLLLLERTRCAALTSRLGSGNAHVVKRFFWSFVDKKAENSDAARSGSCSVSLLGAGCASARRGCEGRRLYLYRCRQRRFVSSRRRLPTFLKSPSLCVPSPDPCSATALAVASQLRRVPPVTSLASPLGWARDVFSGGSGIALHF